jgi:hypothetical protein
MALKPRCGIRAYGPDAHTRSMLAASCAGATRRILVTGSR